MNGSTRLINMWWLEDARALSDIIREACSSSICSVSAEYVEVVGFTGKSEMLHRASSKGAV